jgi:hypothetical protein
MAVVAKLSGFLAVLAAVFGVAFLTGTQSATLLAPPALHDTTLGGLSGSADGYTLTAVGSELEPGPDQFVELRLAGPDAGPVSDLAPMEGMADGAMHLFAMRRDLTGFQHITPAPGEETSWWALLSLTPGPWRVVVELQPEGLGRPLVLGVDLTVRGDYRPEPLPPATDTVSVDGLEARRSGALSTRAGAQFAVRVSEDGKPVTDLQPSHGVPGHAVVIRPDDFALAHRHAASSSGSGPRLEFAGGVPQPGTYAVFVEFYRGDRQHVVAYTVEARR